MLSHSASISSIRSASGRLLAVSSKLELMEGSLDLDSLDDKEFQRSPIDGFLEVALVPRSPACYSRNSLNATRWQKLRKKRSWRPTARLFTTITSRRSTKPARR